MPALEIFQHIRKLGGGGGGIQREHPVDDVIRARFVGGIEVARLRRGFERTDDDAGGVRT